MFSKTSKQKKMAQVFFSKEQQIDKNRFRTATVLVTFAVNMTLLRLGHALDSWHTEHYLIIRNVSDVIMM